MTHVTQGAGCGLKITPISWRWVKEGRPRVRIRTSNKGYWKALQFTSGRKLNLCHFNKKFVSESAFYGIVTGFKNTNVIEGFKIIQVFRPGPAKGWPVTI